MNDAELLRHWNSQLGPSVDKSPGRMAKAIGRMDAGQKATLANTFGSDAIMALAKSNPSVYGYH